MKRHTRWLAVAGVVVTAVAGWLLLAGRSAEPGHRIFDRVEDAWHAKTWRDSWDMLSGQYYRDIVSPNFVSLVPDDGKIHWSVLVSDLDAKTASDPTRGEYVKGK